MPDMTHFVCYNRARKTKYCAMKLDGQVRPKGASPGKREEGVLG